MLHRRCAPGFFCALVAVLSLAASLSPVHAAITATGDVSPANPSTWTSSTTGYIGNTGTGSIVVNGGSGLQSSNDYLGNNSSATGVVTVDGNGSYWATSVFTVGSQGVGTLNITNGGSVGYLNGVLGNALGSTGAVTVDGNGSTLSMAEPGYNTYLNVGGAGSGTLNVTNGGSVSSGSGILGSSSNSTGTVTVNGSNSTWTNTNSLVVGDYGAGI